MAHRMGSHGWRITAVGVLTGTLLVGTPLMSKATVQTAEVRTPAAAKVGNTYGGLTSQGLPVIVDMTENRRKVVRAVAALHLTCTSGAVASLPDEYTRLPVSKKRKFGTSFGPVTVRNDDGTTTDLEGRIQGRLNSAKTKITGSWAFTATDHDAAGAVIDTCASGQVSWNAKQ